MIIKINYMTMTSLKIIFIYKGTWSGNLVLKHLHPIFQSDVYICLETIGALINLVGPDKFDPSINVTPEQLMNESLEGKLIYAIKFQAYDKSNTFIRTYKVMPRSQNSHAYVTAGFRVQVIYCTQMIK
jgi:xanthine dehydrogenase/oxidase